MIKTLLPVLCAALVSGQEPKTEAFGPAFTMMKPTLDVGIIVTGVDRAKAFYETALGLQLSGTLPMPDGSTMYRYLSGTSVLKIRVAPKAAKHPTGVRDAIGFRLLTLYVQDFKGVLDRMPTNPKPQVYGDRVAFVQDPDGNVVELVKVDSPADGMAVGLTVADVEASRKFYGEVLGLPELKPEPQPLLNGDMKYTFKAGNTQIKFWKGASGAPDLPKHTGSITNAFGFRYFTFIVKDVDAAAEELKRRGAKIALAPVDFGKVARIMMVEDPDGNWVELAAPKSK